MSATNRPPTNRPRGARRSRSDRPIPRGPLAALLLPFLATPALCSLAPPAGASPAPPGSGQERATTATSDEPDARELRRVLALADGTFVRGKTRFREGLWEVRRDRRWDALPEGAVRSARRERELVDEGRRLAAEVPRGDLARRTELARWMLSAGLVEESLDQLDRVLSKDADHAGARDVLARHPRLAELPDLAELRADPSGGLRATLAVGAGAGAARRELVARDLERTFGADSLRDVLAHELVVGAFRRRAFATLALRRLLPGTQVKELLRRAALDPVAEVRLGASLALRQLGAEQPGIILPLVRALDSEDVAVRTNAAESLGNIGVPAAVGPLVARFAKVGKPVVQGTAPAYGMNGSLFISNQLAYVKDFDLEIAQGASIADPVIDTVTEGVLLDVRIGGISGYRMITEYRTVRGSLEQLTGANPGRSPEAWQGWYDANRERFEARATPATDGAR